MNTFLQGLFMQLLFGQLVSASTSLLIIILTRNPVHLDVFGGVM
jgi:hypothetical protein